jgi:hypothetical protein
VDTSIINYNDEIGNDMNREYESSVRASALEWLTEIDVDAFAQEFIALERDASGPTVEEYCAFMASLHPVESDSKGEWLSSKGLLPWRGILHIGPLEAKELVCSLYLSRNIHCGNDEVYPVQAHSFDGKKIDEFSGQENQSFSPNGTNDQYSLAA